MGTNGDINIIDNDFEPKLNAPNEHYKVWYTEDDYDYDCDINDNDMWMRIPETED